MPHGKEKAITIGVTELVPEMNGSLSDAYQA